MNVEATTISKPPHRWKIALSILIAAVFLLALGLYGSRHYWLEYFLSNQLNKLGYPLQSVQKYDLSLDQLTIDGLIAGNNQELRLKEIRVQWNWQDLLEGKLAALTIDGLYFRANLDEMLAKQSASTSASPWLDEKNIRIPWLPVFSIKNASIELRYKDQDVKVEISGDTKPHESQQANVIDLDIAASGSLGKIATNLQTTLDTQGNMQGRIDISNGALNLPESKIGNLSGNVSFELAAFALQKMQTTLMIKDIQQTTSSIDSPLQKLNIDELVITSTIHKEKESLLGTLDLAFTYGEFIAKSLHFKKTSFSLPFNIRGNHDTLQINLQRDGQMDVGHVTGDYPVLIKNPLSIAITRANIELEQHEEGINFKHDILIHPKRISAIYQDVDTRGKKTTPHDIQLDAGKISLIGQQSINNPYRGNIVLNNATLGLPKSQLKLSGISTHLHINSPVTNQVADLAIQQVKHLSPTPVFVPLSISGNITHQTNKNNSAKYFLNLTGGTSTLRYLKINAEHALESGNGFLNLHIVPMKFSRGGLQPAQLFPALAAIKNVNGQFDGKAGIQWSKNKVLKSHGRIAANNFSWTHDSGMQINELNTQLHLKSLLPIQSEPKQKLTIQTIDFGTLIKDLLVSYQMTAKDSPQILLDQMRFLILDGEVSINPTVIHLSPDSGISYINANLDNIDLNTFFHWIEIDGLGGDGRLFGKIPLVLKKNGIAIANGQLAAKSPGTLRFQSQKVTELLANKAEEVDLLLQAMRDFRYKELTLNLDKSEMHDLHVKLSVLGNNPNVKDGQDFRLNVQLESKIDKLLKAIQQGLLFSNKVLHDSLMH